MPFDPNQPSELVSQPEKSPPAFDPSQPSELVSVPTKSAPAFDPGQPSELVHIPTSGPSVRAITTGYHGVDSSSPEYKMEGGKTDKMGKPLHTLDAFLRGDIGWVGVAGDPRFKYGTEMTSPDYPGVPFRIVDTGEAFKGAGASHFDIARDNSAGANSDVNNRPATFQFTDNVDIPEKLQPPGSDEMLSQGNLDPFNRPVLKNSDGTYSTTSSISIGTDIGEVLIPTVVGGQRLSREQAIEHYKQTNENLGVFKTSDAADAYAQWLHNQQAESPQFRQQVEADQPPEPPFLASESDTYPHEPYDPKLLLNNLVDAGIPQPLGQQEGTMAQLGAAAVNFPVAVANFALSPAGLLTAGVFPGLPAAVQRTIAAGFGGQQAVAAVQAPTLQGKVEAGLGAALGGVGAVLPKGTFKSFDQIPSEGTYKTETGSYTIKTSRRRKGGETNAISTGEQPQGNRTQHQEGGGSGQAAPPSDSNSVIGGTPGTAPEQGPVENISDNPLPQIKQLTNSVTNALLTKKPGGIKARFARSAQAAGSKAVSSKNALIQAANNMRAAAVALKNYYVNPIVNGDFWGAVRNWHLAENELSWHAREFVKMAKKTIKDPLVREAITNYIEAGGDTATLLSRAQNSNIKYKSGYVAAMRLNPAQKAFAIRIGEYFDAMLRQAVDSGALEDGVDNYVNHYWKRPNKITRALQADIQSGKLQTSFQHARQRIFSSFYEGEQAGFEPVSKDISELVAGYDMAFNRSVAARAFVNELRNGKSSDGEKLVRSTGATQPIPFQATPPEAYLIRSKSVPDAAISADGRPYRVVDHPALRGWKFVVQEEGAPPAYYQTDMLVHPDHYAQLKNLLEPSLLRTGAVGKALKPVFRLGSLAKQTKLSLSIFHLDQEGFHALAHRVNPANLLQIDFNDPTQRLLVHGGLSVADYRSQELFSEGLAGGGLISKVPIIKQTFGRAQNWFNDFLFKDYIPRLKMTMATHAFERNMKRYGNEMSPEQVAQLTANQSNAAFGELNYKMLARDPTFQDLMRLAILAPDFLEARTRFVGQALRPYGQEQRAALLLMGATMWIGSRILNQWLDGNPHFNKPLSVVYNGREYHMRSVLGDLGELFKDPRRFLYNRFSPYTKLGWEVGTGKDYRGINMTKWEIVKDFLSWFNPIITSPNEGSTWPEQIAGSSGISNKMAGTAVNDMFDAARAFREKQTDPKIQAEVARARKETYSESDYRKLSNYLWQGDGERAVTEMIRLMKDQGKPPEVMATYYANLATKPFTGSATLEAQFINELSKDPVQFARWKQAIQERIKLANQFGQLFPFALRDLNKPRH